MQWFASNVIGVAAFHGGWVSAAVGFLFHCVVSVAWAGVYAAVALRVRWMRRHPILAGALFGLIVMATMVYLVVPIGWAPKPTYSAYEYANNVVATTLFFGIPVSFITSSAWTSWRGNGRRA